jgi:hypothetical protein
MGCSITSVQTAGEAEKLQPLFPDVRFVETNLVGDKFRRPHSVRISALLKEAKRGNILILNSDIEVRSNIEDFINRWSDPEPNVLKLGIRWDEDPVTKQLTLLKWGIDAFLITPKIAEHLDDIGMTMGCPAWDYWVPIHLYNHCGYGIVTNKQPELIHEDHPKNWSGAEYKIGLSLLTKQSGLGQKEQSTQIRHLTQRI